MAGRLPICLRPYRRGDLQRFTPRPDFIEDHAVRDWHTLRPGSFRWTLERWGGEVVGVAGAEPLPGAEGSSWHLFAVLSNIGPRDVVWCLRLARATLRWLKSAGRAEMFYAEARAENPAAVACLRHLGFRGERPFVLIDHEYVQLTRIGG